MEAWLACRNNPWHAYPPADPTRCRHCGEVRTAEEALVSLVAGWEGWSTDLAQALVDKHTAEVSGR